MSSNRTPSPYSFKNDARFWAGVVLPTAILVLGSLLLVLCWGPRLPDEVANQWSGGEVTTIRARLSSTFMLFSISLGLLVMLVGSRRIDGGGPWATD